MSCIELQAAGNIYMIQVDITDWKDAFVLSTLGMILLQLRACHTFGPHRARAYLQ